jgi:ribosome-associated protein
VEALEVAQACARIAADKRATDLLILQIGDLLGIADYFVLATARNRRQIKAISNQIRVDLKVHGVRDLHTEGVGTERWVLLDYGSVVVHLFEPDTRAFYDLEALWADAPRIPVEAESSDPKTETA